MQLTMEDLEEIKYALVSWKNTWIDVRIQREEWVKKQMDNGEIGFAEHNRKAVETAKGHYDKASRIIMEIQEMEDELHNLEERPLKEIDIMCHVTSIK